MNTEFTKMHGCGNDYIYVDCTGGMPEDASGLAVRWSDRRFGIGGDGVILICASDCADFRMVMYNADGSTGAMCGNGIRCVGKFVYDKGLTDKTELEIETASGIKQLKLSVAEDGKVNFVRVDMGVPETAAESIPVSGLGESVIGRDVDIAGRTWNMTCVSMGNPHAVVLTEDPAALDLEKTGPVFENSEFFPDRVNTEFVRVLNKKELSMRVWERGSGETLACGTGACACAYAAFINGLSENAVTVHLRGGDLLVEYNEVSGHIFLTGPAVIVFEGKIEL